MGFYFSGGMGNGGDTAILGFHPEMGGKFRPSLTEVGRATAIVGFQTENIRTSYISSLFIVVLFETFFEVLNTFAPPARRHAVPDAVGSVSRLTAREREVLEHLAQGLDNAQIAAHLGLSEKTVRNHLTHIFDKIDVENRGQAIVLAREAGLGD